MLTSSALGTTALVFGCCMRIAGAPLIVDETWEHAIDLAAGPTRRRMQNMDTGYETDMDSTSAERFKGMYNEKSIILRVLWLLFTSDSLYY